MNEYQDQIIKWEPLPNLPLLPLGGVSGDFESDSLRVVANYSYSEPPISIEIRFRGVETFELCEEFSDRLLTIQSSLPRLSHGDYPTYTWPFLEVQNSKWVSEIVARNRAILDYGWRHLIVLTLDRTLHVMTCESVEAWQRAFR